MNFTKNIRDDIKTPETSQIFQRKWLIHIGIYHLAYALFLPLSTVELESYTMTIFALYSVCCDTLYTRAAPSPTTPPPSFLPSRRFATPFPSLPTHPHPCPELIRLTHWTVVINLIFFKPSPPPHHQKKPTWIFCFLRSSIQYRNLGWW